MRPTMSGRGMRIKSIGSVTGAPRMLYGRRLLRRGTDRPTARAHGAGFERTDPDGSPAARFVPACRIVSTARCRAVAPPRPVGAAAARVAAERRPPGAAREPERGWFPDP